MQILLIGQGAREHALAWKLKQSPLCTELYCWPGNPAIHQIAKKIPLPADVSYQTLAFKIIEIGIPQVICGPEAPLAKGLKDDLEQHGIRVFGPSKEASKLESSKAFAKEIMSEANIPTPSCAICQTKEEVAAKAKEVLARDKKVVIKASGLASGKGVFICDSYSSVEDALKTLYGSPMRSACQEVLVESYIQGRECSYFLMLNHGYSETLGFAVDFKKELENDKGPNTGGMGAYSPVPWLPSNAEEIVTSTIIEPLLETLLAKNIHYEGFLYVGLMWTKNGPQVIEFNVRLGDPEAQILAVNDERDWLDFILSASKQKQKHWQAALPKPRAEAPMPKVVGIVVASRSYPFGTSDLCNGKAPMLPKSSFTQTTNRLTFGSAVNAPGPNKTELFPKDGRVLTVVGKGESFRAAKLNAEAFIKELQQTWPSAKWRKDIASLAIAEERKQDGII